MTVTRQSLRFKCRVDGCPWPKDEEMHRPWCGHQGQMTHLHHPKKGMGGHNRSSRIVAIACWPCHSKIDNDIGTLFVKDIPYRGLTVWGADLRGRILFERILVPCDGADDPGSHSLAPVQPSASSQAGGEAPIAPQLSSPSSPALMGDAIVGGVRVGLISESSTAAPALFSRESWLSEGERLLSMGLQLKGMTDSWRFEIGDWVASGEQHLGEEAYGHFARFEDAFGASYLRGLGWVAASVTRETRQICPSWSHARAVAALPQAKQEAILATVQEKGLSSRETALLVRPAPPERERHTCDCGNEHWLEVKGEWK